MSMSETLHPTSSPDIAELVKALARVQAEIEGAKKDSTNPFFKSKYADLASTWAACKDGLTKNGCAVIQTVDTVGEKIVLITTLAHSSGQWMRGYMPVIMVKQDPQAMGSAIMYARRYSLAAIVGVCPVDDDAEAAMQDSRKPKELPLGPEQVFEIEKMLRGRDTLKKDLLEWAGVKTLSEIPATKYNGAVKAIQNRIEKEKGAA